MLTVALALLLHVGPTPLSQAARRGRDVLESAECVRCHDVTDASGAKGRGPRYVQTPNHCIRCHAGIVASQGDPKALAELRARYPQWDSYLKNLQHYLAVPDLGTLTRRVDPAFVRRYLDAPFDLRPNMPETMVPVRLTAAQKDDVVAYLSELNAGAVATLEPATPPPPGARLAEGAARFKALGCGGCHLFGNVKVRSDPGEAAWAQMRATARLAPNLRFARERLPRAVMVRWIRDPRSVSPTAAMYNFAVSQADAELLADYLLFADPELDEAAPPASAPEVPLLARPVGFEEVFAQVLGGACMHCHMDPRESHDGGPGNTGGLGFEGIGLNLAHYPGVKAGELRGGERLSILDRGLKGEPPLLLEALLRRYREAGRDLREPLHDARALGTGPGERPGMPLGLPPLSVGQLRLVKTWLEQGAPGPSEAWEAARKKKVASGGFAMGR